VIRNHTGAVRGQFRMSRRPKSGAALSFGLDNRQLVHTYSHFADESFTVRAQELGLAEPPAVAAVPDRRRDAAIQPSLLCLRFASQR
jgi:hypothetical protein